MNSFPPYDPHESSLFFESVSKDDAICSANDLRSFFSWKGKGDKVFPDFYQVLGNTNQPPFYQVQRVKSSAQFFLLFSGPCLSGPLF